MKIAYVNYCNFDEKEGIYRKIISQSKAMHSVFNCVYCIQKRQELIRIFTFENGNTYTVEDIKDKSFLRYVKRFILENQIEIVYFRHKTPTLPIVLFISWLKKKRINCYYEIPTYPFFYEQFKNSKNPLKGICKVVINATLLPIIVKKAYKVVAIVSNTRVRHKSKFVFIHNGSEILDDSIRKTYKLHHPIKFIGVGTIYPYHGYDLLLNLLESDKDGLFKIDIFGESETIDRIKKEAEKKKLHSIVFRGKIDNKLLREEYQKYDFGLGGLALERRHANIDTTLKVVEYLIYGLPVITSGSLFYGSSVLDSFAYKIDEDMLCCPKLLYDRLVNYYSTTDFDNFAIEARKEYSWDNIFKYIFIDCENE